MAAKQLNKQTENCQKVRPKSRSLTSTSAFEVLFFFFQQKLLLCTTQSSFHSHQSLTNSLSQAKLQMSLDLCPIILFFFFFILTISRVGAIGMNWGNTASHPLPPPKVVELLKSNNITKVKLFDADPLVLPALSGSNIGVTVGIPNTMLRSFNSSKKAAESWVHDNVTRYFSNGGSGVRIEYVFLISLSFLGLWLNGV